MMTAGSKVDGKNNGASYQSPMEETLTQMPPLPILPFDLVTEILSWVPVKFLLQFRCVCKSWNYLISQDSNFQKKQLSHGRLHLILTPPPVSYFGKLRLSDFLMSSIFNNNNNNLSTITPTQINYPLRLNAGGRSFGVGCSYGAVSSLDGIFCFGIDVLSALVFNPSIRKFNLLPPLENPQQNPYRHTNYTLFYHRFTDNYNIVAVSTPKNGQINVHTHAFGTNYWTRIQSIPFDCRFRGVGISVSDTIVDWLVYDNDNRLWVILSLDLEQESYQKLLHPLSNERYDSNMRFQKLKGCLCILSQRPNYSDVWIMKEHGNVQSWTKFLSVPYMTDPMFYAYSMSVYVSEDDKVLMEFKKKFGKFSLVIYDFRNGTFNIPKIKDIDHGLMIPNIYVESLIAQY